MPKYDFFCKDCGKTVEIYQGITQFDELDCECGGIMKRQFPTSAKFQVRWGRPAVRKRVRKMGA